MEERERERERERGEKSEVGNAKRVLLRFKFIFVPFAFVFPPFFSLRSLVSYLHKDQWAVHLRNESGEKEKKERERPRNRES